MTALTDQADITAVLGHIDLARKLLEEMNYQEFGYAETHLHDALQAIQAWKDSKLTKRDATYKEATQ